VSSRDAADALGLHIERGGHLGVGHSGGVKFTDDTLTMEPQPSLHLGYCRKHLRERGSRLKACWLILDIR
jgi:hypothetical protein